MKLNYKIHQSLLDPVETQDADGKVVEVHYMNDTNYLARYAGKGQFSLWTSDGNDFKLLIERGYYEELKPLFSATINGIWIRFFEKVQKIRQDLFRKIILPILAGALVIISIFSFVPQLADFRMYVLLAMLVVVLFVNILQSSYMRKKVEAARTEAVGDIKDHLGINQFQELIQKQNDYYDNYFKFEDEPAVVDEPEVEDAEVEEIGAEVEDAEVEVAEEPEIEVVEETEVVEENETE